MPVPPIWSRDQSYLQQDKKTADQAPAIWTPEEMWKLLKVWMPNLLPLVVFGAFSGIRSAEIYRLEWQDVLWDQGYIEIKVKKAKTNRTHSGGRDAAFEDIFWALLNSSEFLFNL